MEFRKTVKADVPKVMEIINQAKDYLKDKESTNGKRDIQMKSLYTTI